MIFSNTAIIVDKAAKLINTKNNVPQTWPNHISLKILGNVINTNPGPLPGLTPKAKQAGKIINPDNKATNVSNVQTLIVSPNKRRFLSI